MDHVPRRCKADAHVYGVCTTFPSFLQRPSEIQTPSFLVMMANSFSAYEKRGDSKETSYHTSYLPCLRLICLTNDIVLLYNVANPSWPFSETITRRGTHVGV